MRWPDQLKLSSKIGTASALTDELKQSGMVAMATVLNFTRGLCYDFGVSHCDWTQAYFMTLRVEPMGAEPFQVTNHEFLFKKFAPWPAEVVPVIYDSADPSRIVLDRRFESLAAAARINEPNLPKDLDVTQIRIEWTLAHGDEVNRRLSDFADTSAKAVSVAQKLGELPSDPAAALAQLGIAPERISTIAAGPTPPGGVRATGGAEADPADMQRITNAILAGKITVPIAATFPIEQVREAVTLQAGRHAHGKIVITL